MAGVGDVYYCKMTNNLEISNYKQKRYKPEKFKFIWESSNKIKFGSKGFFKNLDINIFQSYPDIERFRASVGLEAISFNKDIFTYAKPGYYEIIVITATCSKF